MRSIQSIKPRASYTCLSSQVELIAELTSKVPQMLLICQDFRSKLILGERTVELTLETAIKHINDQQPQSASDAIILARSRIKKAQKVTPVVVSISLNP